MLETVAKDFVKVRFEKRDGVVGVLLVGSAALGYVDNLSDIDLEVVATNKLHREVEACPEVSEQYRGIDISWEWMTFKEFARQLKNWEDDVDLWIYSKSKILFDTQNTLRNFLHKYKHYPKKIWLDKLFHYWFFATGNAPYDSGKAIQRGDLITAQLYLNQAIEYYTALIFILNNKFVPYRKWRLKELENLAYVPIDFKENVHEILTTRNWTGEEFKIKQDSINELARCLEEELVKAGVSAEKLQNPWKFKFHTCLELEGRRL